MKHKFDRVDLAPGQSAVFKYNEGCRYVYITKGEHETLKRGKPVTLVEDQEFMVTASTPIQVSFMYD